MVDVSQYVIVREIDCGTTDGLWVSEIHEGKEKIESFRERLIGRFAVGDVVNPITGKVIGVGSTQSGISQTLTRPTGRNEIFQNVQTFAVVCTNGRCVEETDH